MQEDEADWEARLRDSARAARQDALEHGLELIEGGAIDRINHGRRWPVTENRFAVAFD
jgi:hypothetical protein